MGATGTLSCVNVVGSAQAVERSGPGGRPSGDPAGLLDALPLPALRPTRVSMEVTPPEGARVVGASPGVVTSGSPVTWTDAPTTPQAVWVRYEPSG